MWFLVPMSLQYTAILLSSLSIYVSWSLIRRKKSPFDNIPGPPCKSFFYGNIKEIFNKDGWEYHRKMWNYGGLSMFKGLVGKNYIYTFDPLALKHVLIKDSDGFEEPEALIIMHEQLFGNGLLATIGAKHKRQRKMLNTAFSIGHLKDILPMLYPIIYQLREGIMLEINQGKKQVDIMSWMTRVALECIAQGGLGHTLSTFGSGGKSNVYGSAIKKLLPLSFQAYVFKDPLPFLNKLGAIKLGNSLVYILPWGLPKEIKGAIDAVQDASVQVLKKKRALEKEGGVTEEPLGRGKDIMNVLLKENMDASIAEDEIVGHMNAMLFAATDTTSSAMSRILSVLAQNPDEQSRLREEVTIARKEHGDLDYDKLQLLPYLDAVCRETLRVYPPGSSVTREALKDTVIPLQFPIKSKDGLSDIDEVFVPKGTEIYISILGANRSKMIWGEDAEEWKPSRWLGSLPSSVSEAHLPGVYSQMMTFLGGGRSCIGFKLAEMEIKLVTSVLIEAFVFEPAVDVSWDMGLVSTPRIKSSTDITPSLPLKVIPVSNLESSLSDNISQ